MTRFPLGLSLFTAVLAGVAAASAQAPPAAVPNAAAAAAQPAAAPHAAKPTTTDAEGTVLPNGMVQVRFRSLSGGVNPDSVQGICVSGIPSRHLVVVPWNKQWISVEQLAANDRQKLREWFASVFKGASVVNGVWSGTAEFVDYQPLLQLVLLELHESDSYPAPVKLSDGVKHVEQQVFVHKWDGRDHILQGQLTVPYPTDSFPWRIKLADNEQLNAGVAIAGREGRLIGLLTDLQSIEPRAPLGDATVIIPANYVDAMVQIQDPGVNDELDILLIGMAMEKERAQVKALRDALPSPVAATSTAETYATPATAPGVQPPGVAEPAYGVPPPRELKVFHLMHVESNVAIDVLKSLFDSEATFSVVPSQRTVIANGIPDTLKMVEDLLSALDAEPQSGKTNAGSEAQKSAPARTGSERPSGEIRLFYLKHLSPADAVAAIAPLFGGGQPVVSGFQVHTVSGPTFVTVPSQRLLIARGEADTLKKVEELLEALDVAPPEGVTTAGSGLKGALIEASTDALAQRLKPPAENSVDVVHAAPSPVAQLRIAAAEHAARAQEMAQQARQPAALKIKNPQEALRQAVAEAFDARQQLQQAELAELETQLAAMRRTLTARERIKEQIIERRVEELLNPALEWDTSGGGTAPRSAPASGAGVPMLPRQVENLSGTAPIVAPAVPVPPGGLQVLVPEPVRNGPERLYQGRTESDWQRLFEAETEPAAKVEAALALLTLAAQMPPLQHVERILDIGEEIYQSAYGEAALEAAFDTSITLKNGKLWTVDESGDAGRLLRTYFTELDNQTKSLLGRHLGAGVLRALREGSDARAAYAFMLLRGPASSEISGDRETAKTVFDGLDAPLTGIDRSALNLFGQLQVSQRLNEREIAAVADKLCQLIGLIRTTPDAGLAGAVRADFLNIHWGNVTPDRRPFSTPVVSQELARLVLDEIVAGTGTRSILLDLMRSGVQISRADVLPRLRQQVGPALIAWTSVANEYLAQRTAPFTDADGRVARATGSVLALYSDGDDWPVERTAEILTERLRAAYTDDPSATADERHAMLPAKPTTMLAQIVAINGRIPEFVKTGTSNSVGVRTELKRLDDLLETARAGREIEIPPSRLLDEVPYQIVSRCVDEAFPARSSFAFHELLWTEAGTPAGLLNAVSSRRSKARERSFAPIDPLLFLAIAADLSGVNKTQDEHIASILAPLNPPYLFRDPIEQLLASKVQSRHHAERMLREIAAKTASPVLIEMIRSIDPALVDKNRSAEPASAAAPATSPAK